MDSFYFYDINGKISILILDNYSNFINSTIITFPMSYFLRTPFLKKTIVFIVAFFSNTIFLECGNGE